MLDDWLTTNSPFGVMWAVLLAYIFIFIVVGWLAVKMSQLNKAKVVYAIIVFIGFILFVKTVIGYDITGILWDAWTTFKNWLIGGGA